MRCSAQRAASRRRSRSLAKRVRTTGSGEVSRRRRSSRTRLIVNACWSTICRCACCVCCVSPMKVCTRPRWSSSRVENVGDGTLRKRVTRPAPSRMGVRGALSSSSASSSRLETPPRFDDDLLLRTGVGDGAKATLSVAVAGTADGAAAAGAAASGGSDGRASGSSVSWSTNSILHESTRPPNLRQTVWVPPNYSMTSARGNADDIHMVRLVAAIGYDWGATGKPRKAYRATSVSSA